METRIELKQGWKILQDVHDTGEKIGLYAAREADTSVGSQVSGMGGTGGTETSAAYLCQTAIFRA